ncbi:hypothetical protein E2542_SST26617 [Spatholobus suberectus]|nr:hypothetical protein E2542_SST26617 [Spatholobus suberectus]
METVFDRAKLRFPHAFIIEQSPHAPLQGIRDALRDCCQSQWPATVILLPSRFPSMGSTIPYSRAAALLQHAPLLTSTSSRRRRRIQISKHYQSVSRCQGHDDSKTAVVLGLLLRCPWKWSSRPGLPGFTS